MVHYYSRNPRKALSLSTSTAALGLLYYHQKLQMYNDDNNHQLVTSHDCDNRPALESSSVLSRSNVAVISNRIENAKYTSARLLSNLSDGNVTLCTPNSNMGHNTNSNGHIGQSPMRGVVEEIVQSNNDIKLNPMTMTQSIMYKLSILNDQTLPTPRLLSANDPIFTYHKMKRGLKQRERDETKLRGMQSEIASIMQKQQRRQKNNGGNYNMQEENMNAMTGIMEKISEIAYGKGITPQMREDFLIVSFSLHVALSVVTIFSYSFHDYEFLTL